MKETAAADHALIGVVAVHEPVDPSEVIVSIRAGARGGFVRGLLDCRLHPLDAVVGSGVGGEPVGHALVVAGLVQPAERGQHGRHARRIPPASRRVAHTQLIGLELVVAPVLQKQDASGRLGELSEWPQVKARLERMCAGQ